LGDKSTERPTNCDLIAASYGERGISGQGRTSTQSSSGHKTNCANGGNHQNLGTSSLGTSEIAQPKKAIHHWSDEKRELVRNLWIIDGLSASKIARMVGPGVTRNAVIGQVHRMGLPKRSHQTRSSVERKQNRTGFARIDFGRPSRRTTKVVSAPTVKPTEVVVIAITQADPPIEERVTISELGHGVCRFPLGEPTLYCGRVTDGGTYCPAHHKRCHVGRVKTSLFNPDNYQTERKQRCLSKRSLSHLI
jgi:GcrA cell cycle regulator